MDDNVLMDDDLEALNSELQGFTGGGEDSRPSSRASLTFSFGAQDVRYFHIWNLQ